MGGLQARLPDVGGEGKEEVWDVAWQSWWVREEPWWGSSGGRIGMPNVDFGLTGGCPAAPVTDALCGDSEITQGSGTGAAKRVEGVIFDGGREEEGGECAV